MLALTKKTGYGLIAMGYLAHLGPGEQASAREIADKAGVPLSLLMNVLKELSAANYVESIRGSKGGYRLARRPEQINLADLVTTLEGPIRLAQCIIDERDGADECTCQEMARCPNADPVHRVQRKLNDFLKKLTLAEVVEPAHETDGPGWHGHASAVHEHGREPTVAQPREDAATLAEDAPVTVPPKGNSQ